MSATRTWAEPCAPRAALAGDAAAVARVAAELERLGVATERGAPSHHDGRCRVVTAAVELEDDGGISVAVRDGVQRSEGRVVSDPALAAAWIDSWLHDGFEVPAAEVGPAEAPAPQPPGLVAAIAPIGPRWSVAASYDYEWVGGGETWTGFGGGACMRVGELCLGARARYVTGNITTQSSVGQRTDLAGLATASWQHTVGRVSIAPEVALGLGRMTTQRADDCPPVPPSNCMPMDPNCMNPAPPAPSSCTSPVTGQPGSDAVDQATIAPRAAGALRLSVPLADHVWLDGLASVMFNPFGHTEAFSSPGATDPTTGVDLFALPGEPTTLWQLGVGLRVGAP